MNKPILVVMAAGLSSRYGGNGLKQIDPVGPSGEFIIDYSIYDAAKAGFEKVVFVIKPEMEKIFRATIGARAAKRIKVEYAFQVLDDLPEGYSVPEGRIKPWGTGHAVLCARKNIDQPFAVIGADDFFGFGTFRVLADFLKNVDPESTDFVLAGFDIENTISLSGSVSRAVCDVENGFLRGVCERTWIERKPDGHAHYSLDKGKTFIDLPDGVPVSMNTFGFTVKMMEELEKGFPSAIDKMENKLKEEYFLPSAVDALIKADKVSVKVIPTGERWYGVTWHEDREAVMTAIADMIKRGVYPEKLWE